MQDYFPLSNEQRPLIVDLNGTLIRTDLLIESFLFLISRSPLHAMRAFPRFLHGKAALKEYIAEQVALDFQSLPFNEDLIAWLKLQKASGRKIYLASATHAPYVAAIAEHTGLFEGIYACDGTINLAGEHKAAKLCEIFGDHGFDYVGNSRADIPVWKSAAGVFVANANRSVVSTVRKLFPNATELCPRVNNLKNWWRVLRVHQWLKNLLIFVPAAAAHHFDSSTFISLLLAFISFSLCASSVYILNDLLDLRSDREHPTKRLRPFASGHVQILHGLAALPVTLGLALAISLLLPWNFLLVLGGYYALTLIYSVWIKRQAPMDVIALACLYGIRLVAGGMAASVPLSPWLLIFAIFLFFCLALVKRCAELIALKRKGLGNPAGRGYQLDDIPILEALAGSSGGVSVLVFGLYLNSTAATGLYNHPQCLWAILVILLYWISRVLLLTHRGEMHEDPVLFAARDRTSIVCAVLILVIMILGI